MVAVKVREPPEYPREAPFVRSDMTNVTLRVHGGMGGFTNQVVAVPSRSPLPDVVRFHDRLFVKAKDKGYWREAVTWPAG